MAENTNLNVLTNDGMTEQNRTFYVNQLLQYAEPNLVHRQFAKEIPLPKNNGQTINIRWLSPFPTVKTDLVEGVTPSATIMDWNNLTATLRQLGQYVPFSDKVQYTSPDPVIMEVTKKLGDAAGLSIDTLIRDVLVGGSAVMFAPNVADGVETENVNMDTMDATATMTVDMLFKASAKLRANNAPTIDGSYVAIMHPYVAADLMRTKDWQDIVKHRDPDKIYIGEIGEIADIRVVTTTNAKVTEKKAASKTLSVFSTMIVGKDAYGFTELEGAGLEHIVKPLGYKDELNLVGSIGWKSCCLAHRLIENYMVRVETTCKTAPTQAEN